MSNTKEGASLVSVIVAVVVTMLSIMSAIIGISQWIQSRKGKKKSKVEVIVTCLVFVGSFILACFSLPKASDSIDKYKEYEQAVEMQQTEDDQHYTLAQEYIDEGNMFDAIRQLQSISSHYTSYQEAQELLSSCIDTYKESALTEAEALAGKGALSDAIYVIKTAMFLLPEDTDLDLKLEKYSNDLSQNTINNALDEATNYADGGDYSAAITVIQGALDDYPDNQQLMLKKSDYEKIYVKNILEKVSDLLIDHDVDSAVDVLNEALSVIPENSELLQRMDECKNITVNLSSLNYLKEDGKFEDIDTIVANDGSLIKDGFTIWSKNSSRTYAIDGKYSAIVGTFALTEESKNDDVRCVLTITVDGKEYILEEIRAGVRPVSFDIPLTNAKNITFSLYCEKDWTKVVVGNTILYKN